MAPVPVKTLSCDGHTYKCTGELVYGDGNWIAQWDVAVFLQALFGQEKVVNAMSLVFVHKLFCDGDTFMCTANLIHGDGNWVGQWDTDVFHESLF